MFTPWLCKIGVFLNPGKSHGLNGRSDSTPSLLTNFNKRLNIENEQDPTFQHLVRTLEPCWCFSGALAAFSCGVLNPFFVVELQLEAWNQNDPRNAKLFPKDPSGPNFKAEDGVNYKRGFASNAVAMTQKQT